MLEKKILHILLVEDDEVDVMNVRRSFDKNKITNPLYVAFNGLQALEMLRTGEVPKNRRLVLLDLNMPRMNGIEFLRELRKDSELRAIPVVVLTTRPLPSARPETVEPMEGTPRQVTERLAARGFEHIYVDGGIHITGYPSKPAVLPTQADLLNPSVA